LDAKFGCDLAALRSLAAKDIRAHSAAPSARQAVFSRHARADGLVAITDRHSDSNDWLFQATAALSP
jgi:hypothetical protein